MNRFNLQSFVSITTTQNNKITTTKYTQIRNFNQYCKVIKIFSKLKKFNLNPTIAVHFFKDRHNQKIDVMNYGSDLVSFINDFTKQFNVKKPNVKYNPADDSLSPQFK